MEYNEIWELFAWLVEENIPCTIEPLFDGAKIDLNHGDVVQHRGSYGSQNGCVEFGYTGLVDAEFCTATELDNIDFCPIPLEEAKKIFLNNREYFTKMNI